MLMLVSSSRMLRSFYHPERAKAMDCPRLLNIRFGSILLKNSIRAFCAAIFGVSNLT